MKLHCKFSIWNAVTLHDTFILTNKKKIYWGWGKKVNVHLTTIERGIEIFSTFFLRKLIRSCNIFARGGSFFITEFFLMNIWMRKLFLLCQSRVILRLMSSWMNFGVFFFHYFEHIFFSSFAFATTSIQRMCIFHSKSCFNVRVLFFRYKATWETISLLCLTYRLIEMFCWKCILSRCDNALNSTISYPNIFFFSFLFQLQTSHAQTHKLQKQTASNMYTIW